VKPCAEIILENDLLVNVLERLLVSFELLRNITEKEFVKEGKIRFMCIENIIYKSHVKVELRNAINSEFSRCCCVELGVGCELCVNSRPYDGAS